MVFNLVLLLLSFVHLSFQALPADWRSRSIYQVLTDRFALTNDSTTASCNASTLGEYCGGTWKGITNQLDYIEGMGFNAIWISPITKQFEQNTAENQSYHGYWQQDLYAVNEHFGTAADLVELSQALHQRDMYLMIDTVLGQMAWPGPYNTVDYSVFVPFDQESSYHSFCSASEAGENQTAVEDCWLGDSIVSLPDLRTEDQNIANVLYDFVTGIVKNYTADGLRVDSAINLNSEFLSGLDKATGAFTLAEVLQGNTTAACEYQGLVDGFLDYPLYFSLVRAFESTEGSIADLLQQLQQTQSECKDPSLLGTFSENHDNPRFASYTDDMSLAANVLAFDIMSDGIPVIYYGQEQHFDGSSTPSNREELWPSRYNQNASLYKLAATLNVLRTQAIQTNASYLDYWSDAIYSDDHNVAFRKGYPGNQVITVLNNNGANDANFTLTVSGTGFAEGANITEVVSCTSMSAGTNGTLTVTITNGMPAVYASAQMVDQTNICQPGKAIVTIPSSTASSTASKTAITGTTKTAIPKQINMASSNPASHVLVLAVTFLLLLFVLS